MYIYEPGTKRNMGALCPKNEDLKNEQVCVKIIQLFSLSEFECIYPWKWGNSFKSVIFRHMLQIKFMNTSCKITPRWMPQSTFDDKSALIHVMAWCCQATSHNLRQCWSRSMLPYDIAKLHWVNDNFNILRPRQDGRLFPDDIFKSIFFNENVQILIKISPTFVPKAPINNIPLLVQVMAWHQPGDKPFSEPMMVSLLTHICVTRPQWVNLIFQSIFMNHWKDEWQSMWMNYTILIGVWHGWRRWINKMINIMDFLW